MKRSLFFIDRLTAGKVAVCILPAMDMVPKIYALEIPNNMDIMIARKVAKATGHMPLTVQQQIRVRSQYLSY